MTKKETLDQLHSVYSRFCAWTREEVPEYMGGKLQQDIIDALLAAARAIDQLPDEPSEDARSLGQAIRECLLRKQPVPESLAQSAIAYLDPPIDGSEGPWCDNCGNDEDAHIGPELKCPPGNRRAE